MTQTSNLDNILAMRSEAPDLEEGFCEDGLVGDLDRDVGDLDLRWVFKYFYACEYVSSRADRKPFSRFLSMQILAGKPRGNLLM